MSDLITRERPAAGEPAGLLVLHHGRGTNEQDLLPLADVLDPERRLHVVTPRGAFVGLTVRHGRAHMTRAVMEGVAFSMRDGLEIMRRLGTPDDDLRAVGGGARSPLWLQLQAEVYGRPIRRTEVDEGPAYGAALLGGVAAGVFADVAEASARVRLRDEVTEPDGQRARRYDELYTIYRSLYGALREQMHELGRLARG